MTRADDQYGQITETQYHALMPVLEHSNPTIHVPVNEATPEPFKTGIIR